MTDIQLQNTQNITINITALLSLWYYTEQEGCRIKPSLCIILSKKR